MESQEKKMYEVAYHLSPVVGEGDSLKVALELREKMEAHGATITHDEAPKYNQLQYTITRSKGGKREHSDSSFFGYMRFEALPEVVSLVKNVFQESDSVIRSSLVVIEPHKAATRTRPAQFRSVFADKEVPPIESKEEVGVEELDKEIEKLVVE